MAKYYLSVSGENFIGTGFFGEPFETKEELRAAMHKYGAYEENGVRYWHDEIKITVSSAKSVDEFKAAGDKSCKEKGFVNLFELAAIYNKDPLSRFKIFYRPGCWIDDDGRVFKFVLVVDGEPHPQFDTTLTKILQSIGVEI